MTNEDVRDILRKLEEKRAKNTSTVEPSHRGGAKSNLDRVVGGKSTGGQSAQSKKLGKEYAQYMKKHHPQLIGGNFWSDFKKGFDIVAKPAAKVAKAVAPMAGPAGMAGALALDAVGYGTTGGKKAKKPRKLSDKQRKRNALVRQLMKEHGMSLPQASKYIKENGLI